MMCGRFQGLILLFWALASAPAALAAEWRVGTTYFRSVEDKASGWVLSPGCNSQCAAWMAAKKAHAMTPSKEQLAGGKNPGSVLCHQFRGANVLIAVDGSGNQQSFCVFADKSFISTASLLDASR